jgi:cyclophilin family peptidyl-prolyl cis-trans isomerase
MSRIGLLTLLLALVGRIVMAQDAAAPAEKEAAKPAENQPAAPKPEAAAAREAFEALRQQWIDTTKQIQTVDGQRRSAQGDQRTKLDAQIAELKKQADEILRKITDAGLAVYKADPNAYPDINNTLIYIAQFFLSGDPNGDGGDQYEKALPLLKGLVDAGAGEKWPQLYLWGAIAAYCTNEFDLAEQYFAKSGQAGSEDGGLPANMVEAAAQYRQNLPTIKKAWEKEKQIREAEAKADNLPRVKLTTTKGDIVLEMFENEAPQSVANFITLVKKGFYNGVPFHRVVAGFMAQGGDPQGTGAGGPGYNIKDEQRLANARRHYRGVLSMANTGQPNSGGSQFFLTYVPTSFLDGGHAVFGRVIEGMDVAASMKRGEPVSSPDKILKAEVLRDRGHAYEFEKFPE